MSLRSFFSGPFVALFIFFASFLPTDAIALTTHCSPDCNACPSCNFCGQNCTLTQGYWKDHPQCWPPAFDPQTQMTCLMLWTTILNTPVMGRPWYSLAHQWIAAMLNKANGANTSCIDCSGCMTGCTDALTTAQLLLESSCATINSTMPNALFTCFEMLLNDYNNGMIDGCPGHCASCDSCDCGFCCPMDCNMIADCPNFCDQCLAFDCPNRCDGCPDVCPCPNPCAPCPQCPQCPNCVCQKCPKCPDCKLITCSKPDCRPSNACPDKRHHAHHSQHRKHHSVHHKNKQPLRMKKSPAENKKKANAKSKKSNRLKK